MLTVVSEGFEFELCHFYQEKSKEGSYEELTWRLWNSVQLSAPSTWNPSASSGYGILFDDIALECCWLDRSKTGVAVQLQVSGFNFPMSENPRQTMAARGSFLHALFHHFSNCPAAIIVRVNPGVRFGEAWMSSPIIVHLSTFTFAA